MTQGQARWLRLGGLNQHQGTSSHAVGRISDLWLDTPHQLSDPENYNNPKESNAESAGAYFLIFAVIGNFMMLNLFIAVILEK